MPTEKRLMLFNEEAEAGLDSQALAKVVLKRLGLHPRKTGSTDNLYKVLLELYERQKQALQMKDPALALLTVDEMAMLAKISRQTMYEYLGRWLHINMIQKVSFMDSSKKLVVGYKLRGNSLEEAFQHVKKVYEKHLALTETYISSLQKLIKNEKIRTSMKRK